MRTALCHVLTAATWFVCVVFAPPVSLAQQAAEDADEATITEEYTLEIDGRPVSVRAGEVATVDFAGKKIRAKVTPKPDKLFSAGAVSFRIPRSYSLETEADPDGSRSWTLSGASGVLILIHHPKPLEPKQVVAETAQGMIEQYGPPNVTSAATSIRLGGRAYDGTRLTIKLAGERLIQDVFAIKAGTATVTLIVQETPAPDGSAIAETRRARALLEETFRITDDRR